MSIKKVFKQHFKLVFNDRGQRECQCGYFIGNGDNAGKLHKKHAIQVLEQHEREAKAEALEEAADEIERLENIGDTAQGELNEEQTAEYWLYHGTPKTTWLRDRAAELKETP